MSWGIDLWDQFDNVAGHTSRGIDFCEKILSFMKERSSIELEYAAKMRRLVKSYAPKTDKVEKKKDEDEFTSVKAFNALIREISDLAGQRENVADRLMNVAIKDLHNCLQEVKQERKKLITDGMKQQANYHNQLQVLERVRRQNEKAYRELEKAQEAVYKAEQDAQHVTKLDVDKLKAVVVAKQQAFDESKIELNTEVVRTKSTQNEHFTALMPHFFQLLQAADERRVNSVQGFIKTTAEAERLILPINITCIEAMEQAAKDVDYKVDTVKVIDRFRTGLLPPDDVEVEDPSAGKSSTLQRPDVSKNATISKKRNIFTLLRGQKGDEPREDFSQLPIGQQKKQIRAKIDSLKAELAKENAERDGVVKLRDAYKNNPKLGDASSLNKQFEDNALAITRLQQEITRYENTLAAIGSPVVSPKSAQPTGPVSNQPSGRRLASSSSSSSYTSTAAAGSVQKKTKTSQASVVKRDNDQDSFDEDDDGSCVALYDFKATGDDSLPMRKGESFSVVDRDHGDGWTRVRNSQGNVGYVPSSYIECHFDI